MIVFPTLCNLSNRKMTSDLQSASKHCSRLDETSTRALFWRRDVRRVWKELCILGSHPSKEIAAVGASTSWMQTSLFSQIKVAQVMSLELSLVASPDHIPRQLLMVLCCYQRRFDLKYAIQISCRYLQVESHCNEANMAVQIGAPSLAIGFYFYFLWCSSVIIWAERW